MSRPYTDNVKANGMDKLPVRKAQRLAGYNYSQDGYYFITFCTHNKNTYLGKIVNDPEANELGDACKQDIHMLLSIHGITVNDAIKMMDDRYTNLSVETYCIMPNHVHLIIQIKNDSQIHELPEPFKFGARSHSMLSTAIGFLKMCSAKQIRISNPAIPGVWQRGFHDRIIRNDQEHDLIRKYISTNAKRWRYDVFYLNEV